MALLGKKIFLRQEIPAELLCIEIFLISFRINRIFLIFITVLCLFGRRGCLRRTGQEENPAALCLCVGIFSFVVNRDLYRYLVSHVNAGGGFVCLWMVYIFGKFRDILLHCHSYNLVRSSPFPNHNHLDTSSK